MAGTTITPSNTLHTTVTVPVAKESADANWLAANTFQQLANNAKYALERIAVLITAMKADDALTFSGELVSVANNLAVTGWITGRTRVTTGVVTYAENAYIAHAGADPQCLRSATSATNYTLSLSHSGAEEGDWFRVRNAPGGSNTVTVLNDDGGASLVAIDPGESEMFVFDGSNWVMV